MFTLRFEKQSKQKIASSQADYYVITASRDTFYTIKYWNLIYTTNALQICRNSNIRNSNIRIYKDIKLKNYA